MIRKYLLVLGRNEVSSSPKPLFRDAHEEDLIQDVKKWFDFLEARNQTSPIYQESEAIQVYHAAQCFLPEAQKLLHLLNEKTQKISKE